MAAFPFRGYHGLSIFTHYLKVPNALVTGHATPGGPSLFCAVLTLQPGRIFPSSVTLSFEHNTKGETLQGELVDISEKWWEMLSGLQFVLCTNKTGKTF